MGHYCRPLGASGWCSFLFQGFTRLANDCRPFGTERSQHPHTACAAYIKEQIMALALCPTREELQDYLRGKLSDEASDLLADHLDSCPQCQAELATLPDSDDTLIARLKSPETARPLRRRAELPRSLGSGEVLVCRLWGRRQTFTRRLRRPFTTGPRRISTHRTVGPRRHGHGL